MHVDWVEGPVHLCPLPLARSHPHVPKQQLYRTRGAHGAKLDVLLCEIWQRVQAHVRTQLKKQAFGDLGELEGAQLLCELVRVVPRVTVALDLPGLEEVRQTAQHGQLHGRLFSRLTVASPLQYRLREPRRHARSGVLELKEHARQSRLGNARLPLYDAGHAALDALVHAQHLHGEVQGQHELLLVEDRQAAQREVKRLPTGAPLRPYVGQLDA
mmetsp:Transcript_2974/g.6679  ORF Transcript_2974/g.6679 Transcript_2974/m.6679 type:complete len:214 (+) Transcript_2974:511-1152(+)